MVPAPGSRKPPPDSRGGAEAPEGSGAKRPGGTAPSILIVDDDALLRTAVARMLKRMSSKVRMADSGDLALAILTAEGPFDILLTDFDMPGRDGPSLLEEVRKLAPNTHRVLMSGTERRTPEGDPHLWEKFILKPPTLETLSALMEERASS